VSIRGDMPLRRRFTKFASPTASIPKRVGGISVRDKKLSISEMICFRKGSGLSNFVCISNSTTKNGLPH
jgi:hypothetical protein